VRGQFVAFIVIYTLLTVAHSAIIFTNSYSWDLSGDHHDSVKSPLSKIMGCENKVRRIKKNPPKRVSHRSSPDYRRRILRIAIMAIKLAMKIIAHSDIVGIGAGGAGGAIVMSNLRPAFVSIRATYTASLSAVNVTVMTVPEATKPW
jgi:hypothetical protein